MGFDVQVQGMRSDATEWAGFADTLSTCSTSLLVGSGGKAKFGLIANFVSLGDAHTALNAMVRGLLGDGSTWFDDVSASLTAAALLYDETDAGEGQRQGGQGPR